MSTIPTFNKFKSTTIYGAFNNLDYEDNTIQASSNIQRNLTVGGDLSCNGIINGNKLFYNGVDISSNFLQKDISGNVSISGIINGNKLYYDNVDISSTFVSNTSLTTTLNSYALSSTLSNYVMSGGSASFNMLNLNQPAFIQFLDSSGNAKALIYPSAISNVFRFSVLSGNGFEWEEAGTTLMQLNTSGHLTLSGATFSGNVSGVTTATSDNSNKFATTAFVKNQNYITSNPDLSPYALLTGAAFTGNVSGLTALSTDNTNKFATTAFVKAQNYLTSSALSSTLNDYALLSGATFTGNVNGLTAVSTDNSTKFATTAFVKAQNYITSSALSPYALSSSLSNYALSSSLSNYALSSTLNNYALLSGATFTGNVNGLTAFSTDNTTKFATTAFVKAQNYITSSALSSYALTSSLSSYALTSSLSSYALLSGATFSGALNAITQAVADNSTLVATTAWVKLQNYLTSTSPTTSTTTLTAPSYPTYITFVVSSGTYKSNRRLNITLQRTYINGITQLNYSTATDFLEFNENTFTPNGGVQGTSQYIIIGTVSAPVPTQTLKQFIFGYDFNGAQMPFYATIIPDINGVYYLVLKMTGVNGSLNQFGGTYSFPNFNLMYI